MKKIETSQKQNADVMQKMQKNLIKRKLLS